MSADVADVEASVSVEEVQESPKCRSRLGRRMMLAALGVAGLTYDTGRSFTRSAESLFRSVERRGEKVEAAINQRSDKVQAQMTAEARARRAKVEEKLNSLTSSVGETGKSIEKAFQSKLESLKIEKGTVVETDEITIEVEPAIEQPWTGYDALNAQEVINSLSTLDRDQLQRTYEYEAATKNRVTVLREIELLQAGMEEPPTTETSVE